MKKAASIVLTVVFFLVFFAGMGVLLHYSKQEVHGIACKELQVSIPGPHEFLTEEDVKGFIDNFYGIYVGQRIEDVGIESIEKMLLTKAQVRDADVWVTDDGVLHAEVIQRDPVMRFEKGGKGCYADRDGNLFPLCENYVADVPVIACDPALGADPEWLSNAIALVRKISENAVWKGRLNAFEVADNGDFILLGENLRIIYGDFSQSARKFSAMEKYFSVIAPKCDYNSVNIKYKGQIICRKDS